MRRNARLSSRTQDNRPKQSPGSASNKLDYSAKGSAQLAQLTTKEALCSMGTPEKQPTRPAGAPGSSALAPRGTPQWPLPKTSPDHRTRILLANVDVEVCRIGCHARLDFLLNVDGAVRRWKGELSDTALLAQNELVVDKLRRFPRAAPATSCGR